MTHGSPDPTARERRSPRTQTSCEATARGEMIADKRPGLAWRGEVKSALSWLEVSREEAGSARRHQIKVFSLGHCHFLRISPAAPKSKRPGPLLSVADLGPLPSARAFSCPF